MRIGEYENLVKVDGFIESDLVATPIIVTLILVLFHFILKRNEHLNKLEKNIYWLAINIKILFSICFVIVHEYILNGGDTHLYYSSAEVLSQHFEANKINGFKLFLRQFYLDDPFIRQFDNDIIPYYESVYFKNPQTYLIVKLIFLLKVIFKFSFLNMNIVFGFISFICTFIFIEQLKQFYPNQKITLLLLLFIPSLIFWTSGILKDAIIWSVLVLIFISILRILKGNFFLSAILLIISTYIIISVRLYLFMGIIPFISLWFILEFIKLHFPRIYTNQTILTLIISINILFITAFHLSGYSLNYILEKANDYRYYKLLSDQTDQTLNSAFDIGEYKSIEQLIIKIPIALFTTFYRPLPFEANSLVSFLSSIVNTFWIIVSIYLLIKIKYKYLLKIVLNHPILYFLIPFSTIYAVFIGLSISYYGSIIRYKLYVFPFFILSLIIMYIETNKMYRLKNQVYMFDDTF